jgi:oligoendopeptidase F
MTIKERKSVERENCWNVEALYPTYEEWESDLEKAAAKERPRWPEIEVFKGKLGQNPETLKKAIETLLSIDRKLSELYTYAHLRHDEDITHDQHKVGFNKITSLLHDLAQESSWLEPELLSLSEENIQELIASPILKDYRFHLEKLVRIKKHLLSQKEEELIALAGKALQAPHKAFSAINDADFTFGKVLDGKGIEHELTHGSYGLFLRNHDRTLRERSFKQLHEKYQSYENTLAELLNGNVQSHLFNARARKYSSCLEASLFPKNIDTSVYHALIQAVNDEIGALHKYYQVREKIQGIGELHLYDMYVPLIPEYDIQMSYEEAEQVVIESVASLGTEYQNILKKGFLEDRWVDRYENKNKRSGAYSSGSYGSMPYILMNYKELLRDVFTLAHEAGHSMHSFYSHNHQPYHYSDYPIFLAEVASTFNEELLMQFLLRRSKSKEEKILLINQKIEDIRGTLFRQTMFAEFELLIHTMAEKNIPLTPVILKNEFRNLNEKYFGKSVHVDKEIDIEWARIPHFYYNFYVYQYATGISAALALADNVTKGGTQEREAYLTFLKSGSSDYPIEILQKAGVDMRSTQPVKTAIGKFRNLVEELDKLLTSEASPPSSQKEFSKR